MAGPGNVSTGLLALLDISSGTSAPGQQVEGHGSSEHAGLACEHVVASKPEEVSLQYPIRAIKMLRGSHNQVLAGHSGCMALNLHMT